MKGGKLSGIWHRSRGGISSPPSGFPRAPALCVSFARCRGSIAARGRSRRCGEFSLTPGTADAIAEGQIVILSISAFLNRSLASLIGKSLKADFYKAVFSRGDRSGTRHRLAMLVADEYHLSATVGGALYDDAMALPLIRGFGAGIVAATQTLANLDNAIGPNLRNVLLPNFNTALIFRTAEEATANWASGLFGSRWEEVTTREKQRDHDIIGSTAWRERTFVRNIQRPICTLSDLAQLEPGQAFVHRQFEPSPAGPVWFAETEKVTAG